MTFSNFYEHTNPIFIKLGILKLHDLVFYHNAIFIYDSYDFFIDNDQMNDDQLYLCTLVSFNKTPISMRDVLRKLNYKLQITNY